MKIRLIRATAKIVAFGFLTTTAVFAQVMQQSRPPAGIEKKRQVHAQPPAPTATPASAPTPTPRPAPALTGVEPTADGYVLVGRGFGTDASKVQVIQGHLRLHVSAVASVSDNRITLRLGESVRPRGATEHKVRVAGQESNVISYTHTPPPPKEAYGCATGYELQVDKVGQEDRCYRKVAVSCGNNPFAAVGGGSGNIAVEIDNPPPRNPAMPSGFGNIPPETDGCPRPTSLGAQVPNNTLPPRSAASCPADFEKKIQPGLDQCEYSKPRACAPDRRLLVQAGPDVCTY